MEMDKIKTNEALIARCRKGDKTAFDQLVTEYGTAVYNFIHFMVKNRSLADDVYQETWIKVYRHFSEYHDQGLFKQWLFKIANNQCLNQLRVFKHIFISLSDVMYAGNKDDETLQIADSNYKPDEELELKESFKLVSNLSENLPVKQLQVFSLKMHSDLTFKEIALILNRPLNTVLTQMRTALLTIRKNIKEIYNDV
jgi:RNA polymerase sigma factor (sigma-70 family)